MTGAMSGCLVLAGLVVSGAVVAIAGGAVRDSQESEEEAPVYERFDGMRGVMAIDDQALIEVFDRLAAGDVDAALGAFHSASPEDAAVERNATRGEIAGNGVASPARPVDRATPFDM